MDEISVDDFKKLDLRIGTIKSAEKISGADKLLKLIFDIGEEDRQILAGIAESYPDPSILVGKQVPILLNLSPRKLKGEMSNGMMLAADNAGVPTLLSPINDVPPGSVIK